MKRERFSEEQIIGIPKEAGAGAVVTEPCRRHGMPGATISSLENGEGATLDTMFAVLTVLKPDLELAAHSGAAPALDDLF